MKNQTKRLAVGTIVAAAAGYVAGILTAPKSGKETRKDLANAAVKAKTEAEKKLKALHSELDNLLIKAKSELSNLKSKASKGYIEAVANAQLAKEKAREILSALHEGDADDKDLKKAIDEVKKSIAHLKTYIGKGK